MTGWRTALRVAWREAKRAKGRSALIIAMITLPVAGLVFTVVNYTTFELTPEDKAGRLMGTAEAVAVWPYDSPVVQQPDQLQALPGGQTRSIPAEHTDEQLRALFPVGTEIVRDQTGSLMMRTAAGAGNIGFRSLDYANPVAQGILEPLSGRAPVNADEAALTPEARSRLGADIGDRISSADGSKTFLVTGIAEDPSRLDAATVIVRSAPLTGEVRWLIASPGPVSWTDVKQLNTKGVAVVSRQVLTAPPAAAELYGSRLSGTELPEQLIVLGGLAIVEVMLLAGAAFAVGARRRRRDLALLAASGGTPRQIRRIVLADGVVHGVVAAVLGVVLGLAACTATLVFFEETLMNQRASGLRVDWATVLILAALAVVTGVMAALVPARIASRQDVLAALAGRRGVTRSRRRWIATGLVLGGVGIVVAVFGALQVDLGITLIGLVAGELALVLCTPALVGLAGRLGRWLPPSARIALRDTARNRTAAAPAIAAVMAAVIGSLVVGIVVTSQNGQEQHFTSTRPGDVFVTSAAETGYRPGAHVTSALRDTLPVGRLHEIGLVGCGDKRCDVTPRALPGRECPYLPSVLGRSPNGDETRAALDDSRCEGVRSENSYFGMVQRFTGLAVIVDEAAAEAVSDIPAEDLGAVTAALRAGKVVVDDRNTVDADGTLTLDVRRSGTPDTPPETVRAAGFVLPHRPDAAIVMMTGATARTLGFTEQPYGTLVSTTRMPTVAETDRMTAALGSDYVYGVERGPGGSDEALTALAIVSGVITVGAAAIATGLMAADGRADLGTLAAIGASPGVRRRLTLSQAGVIAGLGSLLGTVAGVAAAVAVLAALNQGLATTWPTPPPYPIVVPWLNLLIAVIGVPVVAMLGAGLLTRSRLPIEHRL